MTSNENSLHNGESDIGGKNKIFVFSHQPRIDKQRYQLFRDKSQYSTFMRELIEKYHVENKDLQKLIIPCQKAINNWQSQVIGIASLDFLPQVSI